MTISPPVALPPFPSDPRLASSGSGSSCVFAPLLVTILALARSALAALVPLSLGLSGFGFNGYSSRSRLGLILHLGSSRLGRRYRNYDLYDLSRPITTYHDLSRPFTTHHDLLRPLMTFTTFTTFYDLSRPLSYSHIQQNCIDYFCQTTGTQYRRGWQNASLTADAEANRLWVLPSGRT